MLELNKIYLGDCLDLMPQIADNSVDMILCDLPYGTTSCKWDSVIPFEPLWEQYRRITKPNAAIVLFGSEPFSSALRMSNIKEWRYDWIWDKVFGGNFVQAKREPIKTHEIISVFNKKGKCPTYYPQKIKRDIPIKAGGNIQKEGKAIRIAVTEHSEEFGNTHKTYEDKFPESQLRFSCRAERGFHPTQKPVDLLRYLIRTYTNEGDVVLDNTMGSGSTIVAAIRENRQYIGIEKDEHFFEIAKKRIKQETSQLSLFNI